MSRFKKCKLPVDRIYAVREIMGQSTREAVTVDYSKPVQQVYVELFKTFIQSDPTAWLLSSVGRRNQLEGLPSWCPDLNHEQPETPLGLYNLSASYHAGFRMPQNTSITADVIGSLDVGRAIQVYAGSNRISLLGICVDVVGKVNSADWQWPEPGQKEAARQALAWNRNCLSIAQDALNADADVIEVHWRTLIANRTHHFEACRTDLSSSYRGMMRHIRMIADPQSESTQTSNDRLSEVRNFAVSVQSACDGRRYFSTKGGRIGLGPGDCLPGHLVCVVYNTSVQYILRLKEQSNERIYIFIGESYVHGLMSAEGLDLRDMGEAVEDRFVLE